MSMIEIWKDIAGYEGLYQVSNLGRVKRLERRVVKCRGGIWICAEKILLPVLHPSGYKRIGLMKQRIRKIVSHHRIVAIAFIPNPRNKPFVNHINGITHDNRIENLEWCTSSENEIHSYKVLGKRTTKYWLGKTGAQHYWSKAIICIENGKKYDCAKDAAKELKLQSANISKVLLGTRNHTGGYTFKFAV